MIIAFKIFTVVGPSLLLIPPTHTRLRRQPTKVLQSKSNRRRRASPFSVRVDLYWNKLSASVATWNRGAVFVLQVYRHCSCKEGSAGLVTQQGVSIVNWSKTFFRPYRLARGGQLKTWAITIKADLEHLSRLRVFGYACSRKDWVKVYSELAQNRRA